MLAILGLMKSVDKIAYESSERAFQIKLAVGK